MKAQNYVITYDQIYWKDPGGILQLCLPKYEIAKTIDEYHGCACVGHYSWKVTTHKIMKASF